MIPGFGPNSKEKWPGFVQEFVFDEMDKSKTLAWLQDWAASAARDVSIYGDEFVFPISSEATPGGVTIRFTYIERGEIVPLGAIDIRVADAGDERDIDGSGGQGGALTVTRLDAEQKTPYIGEMSVMENMIMSLNRANGINPAQTWGMGSYPKSVFSGQGREAGPPDGETGATRAATKRKEKSLLPWQVFMNDVMTGNKSDS